MTLVRGGAGAYPRRRRRRTSLRTVAALSSVSSSELCVLLAAASNSTRTRSRYFSHAAWRLTSSAEPISSQLAPCRCAAPINRSFRTSRARMSCSTALSAPRASDAECTTASMSRVRSIARPLAWELDRCATVCDLEARMGLGMLSRYPDKRLGVKAVVLPFPREARPCSAFRAQVAEWRSPLRRGRPRLPARASRRAVLVASGRAEPEQSARTWHVGLAGDETNEASWAPFLGEIDRDGPARCGDHGRLEGGPDKVGSLPGNKANADCSYYIVGFTGFQITNCFGGKISEGVWRVPFFLGATTSTPGFAGAPLAIQLIRCRAWSANC